MMLAYTQNNEIYYPMACAFENQPPKMFLVRDPKEGQKTLESQQVQDKITGGHVIDCQFIAWKTGKMKSGWFS